MNGLKRTIIAPASTSNIGPGFDALGLGLGLALEVRIETDCPAGFSVDLQGEGKDILPPDGRNVVIKTAREIAGAATDRAAWSIRSQIPVARGLGSSAAARAAGLAAGYFLRDGALPPRHIIFEGVTRHENHPDNASACSFGGLRVCTRQGRDWRSWPGVLADPGLELLLVIPQVPVPTSVARSILPTTYSRSASVRNLQSLSVLLSGLARGDWDAVRCGTSDHLHERYRLPLVPGLSEALVALRADPGLGGAFVSGAGPTLAAFIPAGTSASDAGLESLEILRRAGVAGDRLRIGLDHLGVRLDQSP
jgi:homoserine kinase